VTYSDLLVVTLINESFVPVKADLEQNSALAFQVGALWTPSLNVIDGRENLVYRVEGWLPSSEFAAMAILARGHYFLRGKRYELAAEPFRDVSVNFPRSEWAPEALYYLGVVRYLASQNVEELKKPWNRLQRMYPQSTWSIRSDILG